MMGSLGILHEGRLKAMLSYPIGSFASALKRLIRDKFHSEVVKQRGCRFILRR